MTAHWKMTRKIICWVSVAAAITALPLIATEHDFGWKLLIIAVGGAFAFPDYDSWAPHHFPTRKERKAAGQGQ